MIYFVSDAHIGSWALGDTFDHQRKLIQIFNTFKQDATHVYLLGDMFDFWFEYKSRDRSKKDYEAILQCIRHMVKRGIHVHYLVGNHDMWTFGGLAKMTGVTIHRGAYKVEHFGKRLYMAHGDGLVPPSFEHALQEGEPNAGTPGLSKSQIRKIRRFLRLRTFFRDPTAQALFRYMIPFLGNLIGYSWARYSRMKELKHPCPYKGADHEELVLFAKGFEQVAQEEASGIRPTPKEKPHHHHDYYIFGHRHIALDEKIADDCRVIILGDMFRQFTYAKLDETGEMTLCTAEMNN